MEIPIVLKRSQLHAHYWCFVAVKGSELEVAWQSSCELSVWLLLWEMSPSVNSPGIRVPAMGCTKARVLVTPSRPWHWVQCPTTSNQRCMTPTVHLHSTLFAENQRHSSRIVVKEMDCWSRNTRKLCSFQTFSCRLHTQSYEYTATTSWRLVGKNSTCVVLRTIPTRGVT